MVNKKNNELDSGSVDYTSLQGTSNRPQLVLVLSDSAPAQTFGITKVSPVVINADANSHVLLVEGQGFSTAMTLKIDDV